MNQRVKAALMALTLLSLSASAWGAGSVTVTATNVGAGVTRYDVAWTSSAAGAVSGNTIAIRKGHVKMAEFRPGTGGTQPTDLYDAVLNDAAGVDWLDGQGANLSNATGAPLILFAPEPYYDGVAAMDLVISNAGNAKTGTFVLWVGP